MIAIRDEKRIAQASKLAEDFPALWSAAPPEPRKQLVNAVFESIKVAGGGLTAVLPIPELLPLFAVAVTAGEYTSAVPTGV